MSDPLSLVCRKDNDLCCALTDSGINTVRYRSIGLALESVRDGSAVMILADGYPETTTAFEPSHLAVIRERHLRPYIEFPSWVPGRENRVPKRVERERGVIVSDRFGSEMPPMTIVGIHDCHYLASDAEDPWIVAAHVAGFDCAPFGIPEIAHPLLYECRPNQMLIAETKLSQMVSGRYGPHVAWIIIWNTILSWLQFDRDEESLDFRPAVHPTFDLAETLASDVETRAAVRGCEWYQKAHLLIHDCWKTRLDEAAGWEDRVAPPPDDHLPLGDGSLGILEGHSSRIGYDGSQRVRWYTRADCNGESAMAFGLTGLAGGSQEYISIASNLLDFVYRHSDLQQGPRADLSSPSCGLLGWDTRPEGLEIYYGDDNARAILGTIGALAAIAAKADSGVRQADTTEDEDDERIDSLVRAMIANFRTTGRNGFRGNNLVEETLRTEGWVFQYERELVNCAPHFESWLWAVYLWLYDKTGFDPLFERSRAAIETTMDSYPDRWSWTNGMQQERARMLLPLAWLYRVDAKKEYAAWMRTIAEDLLARQDACGAIAEEVGSAESGKYGPPRSNEEYGRSEATLLQTNGDPVSDLLYTSNFAFFALHEAAAATGDSYFSAAADRLAEFLCRVQAQSEKRGEFDGAWFRAFDFRRWDYWGSNADIGWGPWSTETGWTQGWITATFCLRVLNTSLWDLSRHLQVQKQFEKLREHLIPRIG